MRSFSIGRVRLLAPLELIGKQFRMFRQIRALRRLSTRSVKNLIVGSGGTRYEGWESADKEALNILYENDWGAYFGPNSIDAVIAEHVWEHLTPEEAVIAAMNVFKYLKSGKGYLRAAVPDGLHPSMEYLDHVKPGGEGIGADDHKVLYTYRTFKDLFQAVGFKVSLLEYFDENREFHYSDWNAVDGCIQRSKRFDTRNVAGQLSYTSIILDATKPGNATL